MRRLDNLTGKYVLIGQTPVPEPDVEKWSEWFEQTMRDGSRTVFQTEVGTSVVSTVFLGLDHNWSGKGPPILFETMVFSDGTPGDMRRCSTWLEAEAQHGRMVKEWSERLGVKARTE